MTKAIAIAAIESPVVANAIAVVTNESPVVTNAIATIQNAIAVVAIEFPGRAKGEERKGESERGRAIAQASASGEEFYG